jgi:hypothetical protein
MSEASRAEAGRKIIASMPKEIDKIKADLSKVKK